MSAAGGPFFSLPIVTTLLRLFCFPLSQFNQLLSFRQTKKLARRNRHTHTHTPLYVIASEQGPVWLG